mgnify:CR=1 FL=1
MEWQKRKEMEMESERKSFGQNLRLARKQEGWTLQKVSELTGIPNQTLSRYETGKNIPSVYQAYKLASLFGMTIEEMIGD